MKAQDRFFGHLKPLPPDWIRCKSKSSSRSAKSGATGAEDGPLLQDGVDGGASDGWQDLLFLFSFFSHRFVRGMRDVWSLRTSTGTRFSILGKKSGHVKELTCRCLL